MTCTPEHANANGIQWLRDSQVLSSQLARVTVVGGVLTINPARLEDSGLYVCSAGNSVSLSYVDTNLDIARKKNYVISQKSIKNNYVISKVLRIIMSYRN